MGSQQEISKYGGKEYSNSANIGIDSQKFNNHYNYSGGGVVAGARKTDNLVNMEAPK